METPFIYDQLPHPNDRAFRAREVIGYFLRYGNPVLLESFLLGTNAKYTFGVYDVSGQITPQIIIPAQLRPETKPNRRVSIEVAGTQYAFEAASYAAAIVPVTDERLQENTVQLVA